MNVLILYAHPTQSSFNGALLDQVKQTLTKQSAHVKVADLYAQNFNPVMSAEESRIKDLSQLPVDVQKAQADVQWADWIVFVYPVWWYDRPAILKGWCDRVLSLGFAFDPHPEGSIGLLNDKKAWAIQTNGSTEERLTHEDAATLAQETLRKTLKYCGISLVHLSAFFGVATSTDRERAQMLEAVTATARKIAEG